MEEPAQDIRTSPPPAPLFFIAWTQVNRGHRTQATQPLPISNTQGKTEAALEEQSRQKYKDELKRIRVAMD